MYWNAVNVKPVAPRTLAVQFADGLSGTTRIEPSFCSDVFEALIEDEAIRTARVENGAVTGNGLVLAPDTMYREIPRDSARRGVLTGYTAQGHKLCFTSWAGSPCHLCSLNFKITDYDLVQDNRTAQSIVV